MRKLLLRLCGVEGDHVALQVSTPKNGGLTVSGRAADVQSIAAWWVDSRPDPEADKPRPGFNKD